MEYDSPSVISASGVIIVNVVVNVDGMSMSMSMALKFGFFLEASNQSYLEDIREGFAFVL